MQDYVSCCNRLMKVSHSLRTFPLSANSVSLVLLLTVLSSTSTPMLCVVLTLMHQLSAFNNCILEEPGKETLFSDGVYFRKQLFFPNHVTQ